MPNEITNEDKLKYSGLILRRANLKEITSKTDFGKLRIIFINSETDAMELATPSYEGMEKMYGPRFIANMEHARESIYHTAFIDVTSDYLFCSKEMPDMFSVTYDANTQEIVNMLRLVDFKANCVDYIYHNLDAQDVPYMKQKEI